MALKLTTEQWITKALAIHGKKYNYSLVNYKDAKTPVVVSCKDHGEWNCNPSNHVNKGNARGCPSCGGSKPKTSNDFIRDARYVHGYSYDYANTKYLNSHTPVSIICTVHGAFLQTPTAHLSGTGCKQCASSNSFERVREKSLSSIKKRIFTKHGDHVSIVDASFTNINSEADFICKIHGQFSRFVSSALYKPNTCIQCYQESKKSNKLDQQTAAKRIFSMLLKSKITVEPFVYNGKNDTTLVLNCPKHGKWMATWAVATKNFCNCPKCSYENSIPKRTASIRKHNEASRARRWASYLAKFTKVHGDLYDYSKVEFFDAKAPIEIGCRVHGFYMQNPDSHTIGGCRLCADEELAGLYNYRYFELRPEMATLPATLYLIKLEFSEITCYKIGITRTSLKSRFSSALGKGVKIEVIATRKATLIEVWREEVRLLESNDFEKFETPDLAFARKGRISTTELVTNLPSNWRDLVNWTNTERYLL